MVILWALEKKFPKAMAQRRGVTPRLGDHLDHGGIFFQVIARYGFNTGWSGALEFNTTAFSWLILLGMGYGLRTSLHLGVDIIIKAVPAPMTKALSLLGAACCMLYGLVLLDSSWVALLGVDTKGGAIDYWLKMYKIGIGSEELHYPGFIQDAFGIQSRIHRWLLLLILPLGLALMVFRSLQAFVDIAAGRRKASHQRP
jgi:C4-dicarboxylate transporter DctQ subunit